MARANQNTNLVAVKEKDKYHIKILYSKNSSIRRFTTNVYVKDGKVFKKDRVFRKNNSLFPNNFQADKNKLDEKQLKIETLIEDFVNEHHDKPTVLQLESLYNGFKENSQSSYTYINEYLEEYYSGFGDKTHNEKSVVRSLKNGFDLFCEEQNSKCLFKDLDKAFFKDFINFLLFKKPVTTGIKGSPNHSLNKHGSIFDERFGMNNNTLLKRLEALSTFLKWVIEKKEVKLNYIQLKAELKEAVKELKVKGFEKDEFVFKTKEEVELLASLDFEKCIHEDYYEEIHQGKRVKRSVSRDLLIRAKDYFVVSVLTGTRVSDLIKIKPHNVALKTQKAGKTQTHFQLNSNTIVQQLLKKHKYSLGMNTSKYNKLLKVIMRQFQVEYLKDIRHEYIVDWRGEYEQVKKVASHQLVSSHSGRRSFCTILYYQARLPKRTIMKFSGHKSESMFDKYVKIKAEDELEVVSNFFNLNLNQAVNV